MGLKTVSDELQATLESDAPTLARCVWLQRRDGVTLAYTSADRPVEFDSVVYEPFAAVDLSAIQVKSDASVNVQTAEGFLSDDVTLAAIRAGDWDGCRFRTFEIDYRNPGYGIMKLQSGTLGSLTVADQSLKIELQSLTRNLQNKRGKQVSIYCRNELGDGVGELPGLCEFDVDGAMVVYEVSGALDSKTTCYLTVSSGFTDAPAEHFIGGYVIVGTGENVDRRAEIKSDFIVSPTQRYIELWRPMPNYILEGDVWQLYPGCRKRLLEDCRDRFDQVNNFNGEPHSPGSDALMRYGRLGA